MGLRLSTGMRNLLLQGAFNNAGAAAFDTDAVLEIRTGAKPTSADDAPAGSLLAAIALPADAFGAAAAGAIAKAGTWQDASADGTGTAGHFRIRTAADSGASSGTDRRIDGDCGEGSGDLSFDNTDIAATQSVTIATFTLTMPSG